MTHSEWMIYATMCNPHPVSQWLQSLETSLRNDSLITHFRSNPWWRQLFLRRSGLSPHMAERYPWNAATTCRRAISVMYQMLHWSVFCVLSTPLNQHKQLLELIYWKHAFTLDEYLWSYYFYIFMFWTSFYAVYHSLTSQTSNLRLQIMIFFYWWFGLIWDTLLATVAR